MLRFALDDVAELSGPGRGVYLMKPSAEKDDRIVGALALPKDGTFLAVTPEGFRAAGRALGALRLPTVVVQEGGYDLDAIGELVCEVLTGIEEEANG